MKDGAPASARTAAIEAVLFDADRVLQSAQPGYAGYIDLARDWAVTRQKRLK